MIYPKLAEKLRLNNTQPNNNEVCHYTFCVKRIADNVSVLSRILNILSANTKRVFKQ